MKRFWTTTGISEGPDGFTILLDGKPLKLPGGGQLSLKFPALAAAIAEEWGQAGGAAQTFTPDDLPLTRLATTAMERVPANRAELVRQLTAFGLNDLLCYRADGQPALAAQEHERWQPWLDWAAASLGVNLLTTSGIIPVAQPPETAAFFNNILRQMTDDELAALGVIVPALGSLVLGLAVQAEALAPPEACDLAHLGQLFQESFWGTDADSAKHRQAVLDDVEVSARFMVLCRA